MQAPDGTSVIVKHIRPEGDWFARATGSTTRPLEVWRTGILKEIEPVVEHGVLGVVDFGDHEAIVMRDLSASLFPPDVWLSHSDVDGIMSRLARFHAHAAHMTLPSELCSVRERAGYCNPEFHRQDSGPHARDADGFQQSLDYLVERIGGEAGVELRSFFGNLEAFEAEVLERTVRPTLLHGDTKPENLGMDDDRLVAVDWGEVTGVGPAEFDLVRFCFGASGYQTDLRHDQIHELYTSSVSDPLDPELLRLATLACMANNGIGNLAGVAATTDPDLKERARQRLRNSIDEVRRQFGR